METTFCDIISQLLLRVPLNKCFSSRVIFGKAKHFNTCIFLGEASYIYMIICQCKTLGCKTRVKKRNRATSSEISSDKQGGC